MGCGVLTTGREESPALGEEPTLPSQLPTPQPPTPRRGRTLWVLALLVVLIALILFGLGAMALSLLGGAATSTTKRATPTLIATMSPVQATPTLPSFSVPNAAIKFAAGGQFASTQQCNGTQPLAGLALYMDNAQSTISVDWWVSVTDKMPDGKHIWASAGPPYGTLPAGKGTSATLTPDPALCGEIQGKSSPVTYHATVFYGGIGGFTLTDTITPPPGTPAPTSTAGILP